MLRTVLMGALASGGLCCAALAQEAISTTPAGAAAPKVQGGPAPLRLAPRDPEDAAAPILGPCGGVVGYTDGRPVKPDTKIHGQVWAGVGTSGYREVGAVACTPIKDKGSVTIAVDRAQFGAGPRGW